jgi:cytochrome c-type biogenesis protein CcmE
MKKKQRLIIGVVVIVVLLGYLVLFSGVASSDYNVSAAVAARDDQTNNLTGKVVRINGSMVPETINWDAYNRTLVFKLTDGHSTIDVIYQGNKPNLPPQEDNETNIQAVVTGKFNNEVFESYDIITKCPSKYEESPVVK